MVDMLKNILSNDNAIKIFEILITVFVSFTTAALTTKRVKNQLYIESFKKEGIKTQKKILDFWCSILLLGFEEALNNYAKNSKIEINKIDKIDKENKDIQYLLQNIQRETFMYGSKSTIKALATYQQYIFKNDNHNQDFQKDQMEMLIKATRVATKLKYDFTGEKVNAIDLLKIKLNDLNIKAIFWGYYWLAKCFISENKLLCFLAILMSIIDINLLIKII